MTGNEGNHGEDVKEYYFYLDSTPTHSYMKYLYKYPQAAFPYEQLVEENRRRGKSDPEFELLDTGVFDDESLLRRLRRIRQGTARRHPDPDHRGQSRTRGGAAARLLPTVWFRNTWSWGERGESPIAARRRRRAARSIEVQRTRTTAHAGSYASGAPELLFTENETNNERIFGVANAGPYVKDGINDYVVHGAHRRGQSRASRHQGRRALPR